MHLLRKVVNAAWHSDLKDKPRRLGMWREDPVTGQMIFHNFSLKTLEQVYDVEEKGGDDRRSEERLGDLGKYRSLVPEQFRRNSHNCMNAGLSAKVKRIHRRLSAPS